MNNLLLLMALTLVLSACTPVPETTEQPCKWLINEKTLEYYEYCK
jgi:starvation-inducible outer membrane lipoprotein